MADGIKVRGDLTVTVRNVRTGEVVSTETVKNLIVNTGLNRMVQLLAENLGFTAAGAGITQLEVGKGEAAAQASQEALVTPFSPAQYAGIDSKEVGTNYLLITATIQENYTGIDGEVLKEAGLWAGEGTNKVLFARQAHSPVTKFADQALEYRWKIQFTVG